MLVDEGQYWAFIQYIDNSDETIMNFDLDDFNPETDFPDICQMLRRLQGDLRARINFRSYFCSEDSKIHGTFEIIKEH